MFRIILIIGAGGFIGSIARYLSVQFVHKTFLTSFPLGTLLVNLAGCFLIGIFYGLVERGNLLSNELRMFLTVGFCGGFTTFSTFTADSLALVRDGEFLYVMFYAAMSIFIGFFFTFLGNLLTKIY